MSRKITIRLRPEDLPKPHVLGIVEHALTTPQVAGDEVAVELVSFQGEAAFQPSPDPRGEQVAIAAAERAIRDVRAEASTSQVDDGEPADEVLPLELNADELQAARRAVKTTLLGWAWQGIKVVSRVVVAAARLSQSGP